MRVKASITGELFVDDREKLIKGLLDKKVIVSESSHELCIYFEDHERVIELLREKSGVNVHKVDPKKGDDSRSAA